jgi:transposase
MEQAKVRSRRRHAVELKEQVLAECAEPGASVAAVRQWLLRTA